VYLFWSAGQFKTIEPHFTGRCKQVTGAIGAEDITIHPQTGIAYISAYDRRAVLEGRAGRGGIYAYDLNAAEPKPVNLTLDAGNDFRPHGISLFVDDDYDVIFVVNHEGGKHSVEIYDIKDGGLSHRSTLSGSLLVSPNDLAAVGPNSVYVTNDHRYVSGVMRTLEEYLKLRRSNVVFFDGNHFKEAATGIGYANGINVSADGKTVFVSATTERALHLYDRDQGSAKLVLREKIKLGSGVDNIEIDSSGALWIGAHPKLLTFVRHARDQSKVAPSQVLRLTPKAAGDYDVEEVYLNQGEELAASSVAAVSNMRMLVGAVFDPKFLDCQMAESR
jgi:arylesterase/paraoxonase